MAQDTDRGRLIVVSAPSGAGKTTLIGMLLRRHSRLRFSISYTTRPKRPTEVNGKDYFFVSEPQFREMIERDAFLEYARVFDHWYGTGREHVEGLMARGFTVLLDIDWQGARQVRRRCPNALTVFIMPPSVPELERRLRARGSDPEAVIKRRLADAVDDMGHWQEFDYTVFNDDLELAASDLSAILSSANGRHRSDSPAVSTRALAIIRGGEASRRAD